jgi:hypothetical protein
VSEQELDLGIKRSIAAFRAVMEELAGGDQLVPGGHDVGDDQECLGRTGSGRRDVLAEMALAAGARRRELDQAKIFAGGAVNLCKRYRTSRPREHVILLAEARIQEFS